MQRDDVELSLLRIAAQRLVAPLGDPAAVVAHLSGVQAQDLPASLAAVAMRCDAEPADVVAAATAGEIVRSWPCRGTLHWVPARDLRWMLRLTRARAMTGLHRRAGQLGLTAATLEQAASLAVRLVRDAGPQTRAALRQAWTDAGIDTAGQRAYHLLMRACHEGVLVQGPLRDAEPLFVVADDWLTDERTPDREEGLARWALAWFRSHGPTSVQDFARWASLTLGDARTGLAGCRDQLTSLEVAGQQWWLDPAVPDLLAGHRREARGSLRLPAFDELLLGYAERDCLLTRAQLAQVVPGSNGVFRPLLVTAGRATGTWRGDTETPFT